MKLRILVALLSVFSAQVDAQQFYQIVDPDGRIRMIESSSPKIPSSDAHSSGSPEQLENATPEAAPRTPAMDLKVRELDGDAYMDSEQFERSGFNPEKKKRFFILHDGMGGRVEEVESGLPVAPVGPAFKRDQVEPYQALPDHLQSYAFADPRSRALLAGAECLPPEMPERVKRLSEPGKEHDVLLDRNAHLFVPAGGLVDAFRMPAGQVSRELLVQSYALRDRQPEFVSPIIALADKDGCVLRVVAGVFSRRYQATKSRHARVEGRLTLHTDERFVLIIMPAANTQQGEGYAVSPYGRIGIKWLPIY